MAAEVNRLLRLHSPDENIVLHCDSLIPDQILVPNQRPMIYLKNVTLEIASIHPTIFNLILDHDLFDGQYHGDGFTRGFYRVTMKPSKIKYCTSDLERLAKLLRAELTQEGDMFEDVNVITDGTMISYICIGEYPDLESRFDPYTVMRKWKRMSVL